MENTTQGKFEKWLRDLGHEIDDLVDKAKKEQGKFKEELHERIEHLKSKRDDLEKEFEAYKNKTNGEWGDVRQHFKASFNELKEALQLTWEKITKKQ